MWQTIGHKNQKAFLENVLKNKKYAHAYLFCGPSQIGKKTLAVEFANKILNTKPGSFNPDLNVISIDKVKIEDARTLISELSLRPYQHSHKIVIIDNFDNVTEEAANGLLKTLEEPNQSTIIIMIAANNKAVLPTISSRAQIIYFNRLSDGEIAQVLTDQDMLSLFDGKIGKAIRFEADAAFREKLVGGENRLKSLRESDIAGRIIAIKDYAELEGADLVEVFQHWLDIEHFQTVRNDPARYPNVALLMNGISSLRQNFNKKLVLEKTFLNIK